MNLRGLVVADKTALWRIDYVIRCVRPAGFCWGCGEMVGLRGKAESRPPNIVSSFELGTLVNFARLSSRMDNNP